MRHGRRSAGAGQSRTVRRTDSSLFVCDVELHNHANEYENAARAVG